MLAIAHFRGTAPPRRLSGRQATALAAVALAVLAGGSYRVATVWRQTPPATPLQVIQQAAASSAATMSASATFSTQVNGLTIMFGTVREQLTPTRLATLSMTAVDGAERFSVAEIITRSHVYVSTPGLAVAVGKPWLGVAVSRLGAYPGLVQLYQTGALPSALAGLAGTATSAKLAGTANVQGVPTRRYTGTIDVASALASLRPLLRQLLAPDLTATTGVISFTAWIDTQHHFREIQTQAMIGGRPTVTTVVFTAAGGAVHIEVPQASQVAVMSATK